ncbi:hypothetical protein [Glutamicibacter sp.]|uniref:hypothetical protein n=1 Tax=Glutamicibacter sp. TaxID=1931995 RepID=UPI002FCABDD5
MNAPALIAALRTACQAPMHLGPALSGAMVLRLGYLCLALYAALGKLVRDAGDPRLVLAHLQLTERFAQQVHCEQHAGALHAEATGARALALDSYAALRLPADDPDAITDGLFAGEPDLAPGRCCYKDTAQLLAAWLGISYFEAQRRIADAHLLIGRRTPDGGICAPRFKHLAELYGQGAANRRAIASAARRLERLEPQDTIFDGVPVPLLAHGTDGRSLDQAAAHSLRELGPAAAQKQISTSIRTYKELHGKQLPPKLGMFIGPVKNGVHFFSLRTDATDAQLVHSVLTQAGNPRTKAGRADRDPQQQRPAGSGSSASGGPREGQDSQADQESTAGQNAGNGSGAAPEPPSWLRSDQPMPPWAEEEPEAHDGQNPDGGRTAKQAEAPDEAQDEAQDEPHQQDSPAGQPDLHRRRLNAFMALLRAPFAGGDRKVVIPKFVVYLWLADLQNLADAHGMTANGIDIPPGELRQLLARANIIPMVLGGNSQVLDMGRKMRYHKGRIREAIMARDRGCIVPDCTAPPDHVETDHYQKPWSEGGETSVWSGAGMCTSDHHKRHAGQLEVVDVDGLPHVVMPAHVDPEQKPRRNTYWDARQAGESPARRRPAAQETARPGQEDTPEAASGD